MDRELFMKKYQSASESLNEENILQALKKSIDALYKENPQNPKGHQNLIICMEELSELQKEIAKVLRDKGDYGILEELADVSIGIEYIKLICNIKDSELSKAINVKIDRLVDTLERDGIMN